MTKRKRGSDASSDASGENGTSIQTQRTLFKLDASVRKLAHAIKIAKGFERQKLGRREKNALKEANGQELERIRAEIGGLKVSFVMRIVEF